MKSEVKSILDIGTGNAPIPIILSTLTSAKITGVDLSEGMLNALKEKFKDKEITLNEHTVAAYSPNKKKIYSKFCIK